MDVIIRACKVTEVEILRHLAYETYNQTFRSMNTAETMDKYLEAAFSRDRLQEELSSPRCGFFFMYADGELSGYLKLNEAPEQSDFNDPDSIELERIYVRREFQGRGLGKELITYAVQTARRKGKRYLWLGVWERNDKAIAFYRDMGFVVAGRHDFQMGDEIQHDLIMKRLLEDASVPPMLCENISKKT